MPLGGAALNAPGAPAAAATAAAAAAAAAAEAAAGSQTQTLLRSALADPVDAPAAFNVFSRLLQQRAAAAREATARALARAGGGAVEMRRLEASYGASEDVHAMIRTIREQVVCEKAQAEVALAHKERTIHGLRAKLERLEDVVAAHGMD